MSAPTLYREIDALGGADDRSWNLALVEVLKALERRGFSEAQDAFAIDNPPAFPEVPGDFNAYEGRAGMTLRDWFAGQTLNAVLHDPALTDEYCDKGPKVFAEVAYGIADAMLAARVTPTPVSTFSADADGDPS